MLLRYTVLSTEIRVSAQSLKEGKFISSDFMALEHQLKADS